MKLSEMMRNSYTYHIFISSIKNFMVLTKMAAIFKMAATSVRSVRDLRVIFWSKVMKLSEMMHNSSTYHIFISSNNYFMVMIKMAAIFKMASISVRSVRDFSECFFLVKSMKLSEMMYNSCTYHIFIRSNKYFMDLTKMAAIFKMTTIFPLE